MARVTLNAIIEDCFQTISSDALALSSYTIHAITWLPSSGQMYTALRSWKTARGAISKLIAPKLTIMA